MKFVNISGNYEIDDLTELDNKLIEYYNIFKSSNNIFDKDINLKIIIDLLEFIDLQIKSSVFAERPKYVNINNYNKRNDRAVKYFALVYCYGTSLIKIHKDILNKQNSFIEKFIDCDQVDINIDSMYREAEEKYKESLFSWFPNNVNKCYGATMIIASLIEKSLYDYIYNRTIKDKLVNLKHMVDSEEIKIDNIYSLVYKTAIDIFINNQLIEAYEDIDDFKSNLYDMITNYLEFKSDEKKDFKNLLTNQSYTFGALLNNIYSKKYIEKNYLKFLIILFDKEQLNLRNDMMHCNYDKCYDPFEFSNTAILFHLFLLIGSGYIFN